MDPKNYAALCMRANHWISKGLRKGQSYMIALSEIDLDCYRKIAGTENDPFYVDAKIPQFLACILS